MSQGKVGGPLRVTASSSMDQEGCELGCNEMGCSGEHKQGQKGVELP